MSFITVPAKSLIRKISTGLVLFLGFLGAFSVISPKFTSHGTSLGLTETDVANADAAPAYSQAYYEGGYDVTTAGSGVDMTTTGGDDDCGDGSSSDGSDDDG